MQKRDVADLGQVAGSERTAAERVKPLQVAFAVQSDGGQWEQSWPETASLPDGTGEAAVIPSPLMPAIALLLCARQRSPVLPLPRC